MRKFSLSSLDELPGEVNGCPIRTDYRVILRIFRMLADMNVPDDDKPWILRKMFFVGKFPADADAQFAWFVGMGREAMPGSGERDFDYEQDSAEIYSAFRQVYGIDLFDIKKLHWWRFLALLEGLFCCENALSNKIKLRHIDDGESKRKAALSRQKAAVELTDEVGRREKSINEQLMERLKNGQPVGDLLKG